MVLMSVLWLLDKGLIFPRDAGTGEFEKTLKTKASNT